MNASFSILSRVMGGVIVVGFLALLSPGGVQSQEHVPEQPPTGVLTAQIPPGGGAEISTSVGSRFFTFSADPSRVILKASSRGGNAPSSLVPSYRVMAMVG